LRFFLLLADLWAKSCPGREDDFDGDRFIVIVSL